MTATRDATANTDVLVVLVSHDGAPWLPRTLDALEAQTHPALDVVAVDNASTDGSRALLMDRLGEDRVLVTDRDIGFGAAVAMALDARGPDGPGYVLLLHDDLALAEDAVARLVTELDADPRLGAVGPKLRWWDRPDELYAVGWTIDVTGRADNGVDPGEIDQGQRDQDRRVLFVSTAGMLVRREVFDALGGFDRRYHLFRDDLDLCWRIWLTGHDVEVVPDAVGLHVGAAANYHRLGQTRFLGPRYFAERNTLATLLKNYGAARLVSVVPLFLLVGVAKVLGFLLTRRVSDAWQTVRAWLWNILHLRETWRYRRRVQSRRVRGDAELAGLFGQIAPRLRAYGEVMAAWIAGADVDPAPEPAHRTGPPAEPRSMVARSLELVRRRPSLVAGSTLVVLILAAVWPLLLPGELRGGDLAAWPDSPTAFLGNYVAGWNEAGAFGTSTAASPAQALLGVLHLAVGGSTYLAPRALLVLPLLVGWLLALRAAQEYSRRRPPRVVAATAYTLSPPVLAALTRGDVGALVVFAVLPGIVIGFATLSRRRSDASSAGRAVAGTALLTAVGAAFEPLLFAVVATAGATIAVVAVVRSTDRRWRLAVLARIAVATLAPFALLLPWSWELVTTPQALTSAVEPLGDPVWRWLLLAPDTAVFPGVVAGVGFVLAGVLGLVFGIRRSPWVVTLLWLAAVAGAVAAWWMDRTGIDAWPGLGLLVTAAAFAGLFAVAFAHGQAQLSRHAFGWRQLAALATVIGVVVSVVVVAVDLVTQRWEYYVVGEPPLPSFVASAAADRGDFRVLVVHATGDEVAWDVVDAEGPSMAAYRLRDEPRGLAWVREGVEDLVSGHDPRASDRLGLAGIRYVYAPGQPRDTAFATAMSTQDGAEPRPVATGLLYELTSWLPRAVVLPAEDAEAVATGGGVPDLDEVQVLRRTDPGTYRGHLEDEDAVILVAEPNDGQWVATARGATSSAQVDDLVRVNSPGAGAVVVSHTGSTARGLAVTGQLLVVLLTISLALRPPRFARSFGGREVGT